MTQKNSTDVRKGTAAPADGCQHPLQVGLEESEHQVLTLSHYPAGAVLAGRARLVRGGIRTGHCPTPIGRDDAGVL